MLDIKKHTQLVKLFSFSKGATSPTNKQLVDEMISKFDDNVFQNPNSKFLDPCGGTGTFMIIIYQRLLKYHTSEWILKNMIYIVDKSRVNCDLLKKIGFVNVYNEDFLKNDFKDMKFDVIVGNPPYQNNESESDAGKLYIDITKKSLLLLKPDGIISFLTPDTIVRDGRNKFSIKQIGLKYVDYTTNQFFKEGVTIINWQIDKSYTNSDVKIINADGSVDIRNISESLVDKKDILAVNLIERIKSISNKLFVLDQSAKNKFESNNNNLYKVYSNVNKNKIFYTDKRPVLYGKRKLAISLSSTYKEDMLYDSYDDFGQLHVMTDISDLSDTQILNLKTFLFNKYSIAICKMYRKTTGQGINAILYSFPKIDVNKSYTDNDVFEIFDLSQTDIELLDKYVD